MLTRRPRRRLALVVILASTVAGSAGASAPAAPAVSTAGAAAASTSPGWPATATPGTPALSITPVSPGEQPPADVPCEPGPIRLLAEVVAIDAGAGTATLATPRGRLELEMTPATLAPLEVGDRLVVELVDEPAMTEPEDPICI